MPPIVLETFKIFQIEMDIILQLKLKYNEPLIVTRNDHETLLQNEQDSKYISAEYNISHFFNGIPPYGSLLVLVNSPSKIIVPTGIGKC